LLAAFCVVLPVVLLGSGLGAGIAALLLPILLVAGVLRQTWAWLALMACLLYVAAWSAYYLGESVVALVRGEQRFALWFPPLQVAWLALVAVQVKITWDRWVVSRAARTT
jgi:hypothetical protein